MGLRWFSRSAKGADLAPAKGNALGLSSKKRLALKARFNRSMPWKRADIRSPLQGLKILSIITRGGALGWC